MNAHTSLQVLAGHTFYMKSQTSGVVKGDCMRE